jgi:hypothetical protein
MCLDLVKVGATTVLSLLLSKNCRNNSQNCLLYEPLHYLTKKVHGFSHDQTGDQTVYSVYCTNFKIKIGSSVLYNIVEHLHKHCCQGNPRMSSLCIFDMQMLLSPVYQILKALP